MAAGIATNIVAPQIAVKVQGSPGQSPQDHARMGEQIARAASEHIQQMIGSEIRNQTRPGGCCTGEFALIDKSNLTC
jgi:hypothetical protein